MAGMSTYSEYTVSSTVKTLGAIPDGIKALTETAIAIIGVEGDAVRYRTDGFAPTATVGHKLNVGDTLILQGVGRMQDIKFIRVTTDATLRVSFEAYVW
mgnify:CR=1 FL=1